MNDLFFLSTWSVVGTAAAAMSLERLLPLQCRQFVVVCRAAGDGGCCCLSVRLLSCKSCTAFFSRREAALGIHLVVSRLAGLLGMILHLLVLYMRTTLYDFI